MAPIAPLVKRGIKSIFNYFGYEISRIDISQYNQNIKRQEGLDSVNITPSQKIQLIQSIKEQLAKKECDYEELVNKAMMLHDRFPEEKQILFLLGRTLIDAGRRKDAISLYNDYAIDYPRIPFFSDDSFFTKREFGQKNNIPSIFLSTMGQCGTSFLVHCLRDGLGIPRCPATALGQLDGCIIPSWIERAKNGGVLLVEHLNPTKDNLKMLRMNNMNKMIVHARDIRQSTLSNAYHVKNNLENDTGGLMKNMAGSIEEIISDRFERVLKNRTYWLKGWLDLKERDSESGVKIHLTHFQDMKENAENFIKEILDFYEVPYFKFDFSKIPKPEKGKAHYRSGRLNEWREVLTEDQKTKAVEIMGTDLINKMGWPVQ